MGASMLNFDSFYQLGLGIQIILALTAGFVSFASPCVLPLVPAYIGYMGGQTAQTVVAQIRVGKKASVRRPPLAARLATLSHGLAFVAGFTLFFVSFGLITYALIIRVLGSGNVSLVTDILGRVGGTVIIFFGLHFMGIMPRLFEWLRARPRLLGHPALTPIVAVALALWTVWAWMTPTLILLIGATIFLWLVLGNAFLRPAAFWERTLSRLQTIIYSDTRLEMTASGAQGYHHSAFMGIVFSAGWTPCIGPIFGAILTLVSSGGGSSSLGADIARGTVLLVAYSLGLGIPFLLTALLLDSAQGLLRQLRQHAQIIARFSGVFLVGIGLLVASGQLQDWSLRFSNQFAEASIELEERVVGGVSDLLGVADAQPAADAVGNAPPVSEGLSIPSGSSALALPSADTSTELALPPRVGLSDGDQAPDFTIRTIAGEEYPLSALRGQIVLLNFWATWCGPCEREMPELQAVYDAYRERGFTMIAVNFEESTERIAAFAEEHVLSFPLALDESGAIHERYAIIGQPRTVILDERGVILKTFHGLVVQAQLEAILAERITG